MGEPRLSFFRGALPLLTIGAPSDGPFRWYIPGRFHTPVTPEHKEHLYAMSGAIVRANRPGSCALVASSVELVVVDSRLERQARNESLIREMNERIERLDRAAEAGLEGEHLVFEFLCECGAGERGDASCEEQIEMTVAEYEQVRQQDDRFALFPATRRKSSKPCFGGRNGT